MTGTKIHLKNDKNGTDRDLLFAIRHPSDLVSQSF